MEVSFPDRYHLAVAHFEQVFGNVEETTKLDDMKKLAFFALRQQADKGPCKEPAPYLWNVTERYKHAAWSQLGNMSTFEAMVYFVKQLEEVCGPDWMHSSTPSDKHELSRAPPTEALRDRALESASPEELRKEIVRLRSLLTQNGISFDLPQNPSEELAVKKAEPLRELVEIPKRPELQNLSDITAPPEKPTPNVTSHDRDERPSEGHVYYSSRKLGWLEWLGVTTPPQDSRIV